MTDNRKELDAGGLFAGILLIAVGTLFLLDRLGYADFHYAIHDYWPMVLVALGISRFVDRRRAWSGIWLIVVGLWLQATSMHWYGLTFNSSWPLLLIAAGSVLVLRALLQGIRKESTEVRDDR